MDPSAFMKVMVIHGNKVVFLILENTKQIHEVDVTNSLYQNRQFLDAETMISTTADGQLEYSYILLCRVL